MARSNVEYIDTEVEGADIDEDKTESEFGWLLTGAIRLVIPVAGTVLGVLFILNTVGRIGTNNLYYPGFVIAVLFLLAILIYIEEIYVLYQMYKEQHGGISIASDLKAWLEEWKISVLLLVISTVYLFVTPILGYFTATAIAMPLVILLGGFRDWRIILITTVLILALTYGLFVEAANLRPPEGAFI